MGPMLAGRQHALYRFGSYEADPGTGELRKSGVRVRLQDQPFAVLMMLLERPGELVTRVEIREKLWSNDTFVDFDHALNTVVNKLREALGDSASNPRFIETLTRRGYRFLAPVQRVENGETAARQTPLSAAPPANDEQFAILTQPSEVPAVPRAYARALFALIQIMYLVFYVEALSRLPAVDRILAHWFGRRTWILVVLIVTAVVGVPIRLFLLSAAAFNLRQLGQKFMRLFPIILAFDVLWALAPFLLIRTTGWGGALAASAALLYVPFSQRTLLLMGDRAPS